MPFIQDIEICGWNSDVEITRCDFTWNNWTRSEYPRCMRDKDFPYIYAGPRPDPNQYCYLFTTNDTVFYGAPSNKKALHNIDFYFKIKNITGATSQSGRFTKKQLHYSAQSLMFPFHRLVSVATVAMQLFDPSIKFFSALYFFHYIQYILNQLIFAPGFNPLWNKSTPRTTHEKFVNDDFRLQGNNFAGVQNYSTIVINHLFHLSSLEG